MTSLIAAVAGLVTALAVLSFSIFLHRMVPPLKRALDRGSLRSIPLLISRFINTKED